MGYDAATIFVSHIEPIYFSTNPEHRPHKAKELIEKLALGPCTERDELIPYADYFYPARDELAIGAYENGFVLSDRLLHGQISEKSHALRDRIIASFPAAHILGIELSSGNNVFGYAFYENGDLIRALGGSMDAGCTIDVGPLQPEEEPHFANSQIIEDTLVFTTSILGRPSQFALDAYGESLVFAMTHRYLGSITDRWNIPGDELMLQCFTRQL